MNGAKQNLTPGDWTRLIDKRADDMLLAVRGIEIGVDAGGEILPRSMDVLREAVSKLNETAKLLGGRK